MRGVLLGLSMSVFLPSVMALEANYDPPKQSPVIEHVFVGDFVVALIPEADGKLLYADLQGKVKRFDPSTGERVVLFEVPAVTGPEWGLTGLAKDDAGNFYTMYTTGPPGIDPELNNVSGELRVSKWNGGQEQIIFTTEATRSHNGGRLLWHNNTLFVTLGEHTRGVEPMQKRMTAQDPGSLGGKILRMTGDGTPAVGNPGATGGKFHPLVYSYGHRNPFGIDWDERRHTLVISDPAQDYNEEVNHVPVGGNLGWPLCVGPCTAANASLLDPLVFYPDSITPVGLVVVGDDYYVGSFTHKQIRRVYETPQGWTDEIVAVLEDGLLDVAASPDGEWIYGGTWNGTWRFQTPSGADPDATPRSDPTGSDPAPKRVPSVGFLVTSLVLVGVIAASRRIR